MAGLRRRAGKAQGNGLTTPTVDAIDRIRLDGNIIPHLWYQRIVDSDGKPDLQAIILLSEIVYWYRAQHVKDEATGRVVEVRKKFAADKLQRTYASFGEQFGLSWWQVKRTCDRMKAAGLITTELRTVRLDGGAILPNALFVEPVPAVVAALSDGGTNARIVLAPVLGKTLHERKGAGSSRARTNTDTTPETSSEIFGSSRGDAAGANSTAALPSRTTTKREAARPKQELAPRPKAVRLNVKWPLHFYFGAPASPVVLRQLKEAIEEYRAGNEYLITQRDLNAAAIDARAWWETNRGGDPFGIEAYLKSLRETVQPMLAAIQDAKESGRKPIEATSPYCDLLTPMAAFLGRAPTPSEVWHLQDVVRDWEKKTSYAVTQIGYDNIGLSLLSEWADEPREAATIARATSTHLYRVSQNLPGVQP